MIPTIKCPKEDECGIIALSFEAPRDGRAPIGWKYIVRPPIIEYDFPGTLCLTIKRPKDDNSDLKVTKIPKSDIRTVPVWICPETSDLSPRRLVHCANMIREVNGPEADELRRYSMALDLHEQDNKNGIFNQAKIDRFPAAKELLNRVSEGRAPEGWKYEIRPPLTGYEYSGNLCLTIKRPSQDEREIYATKIPKENMSTQPVWVYPEMSDLSPRRLVNCANLIRHNKGTGADELRRYAMALDLSGQEVNNEILSPANLDNFP